MLNARLPFIFYLSLILSLSLSFVCVVLVVHFQHCVLVEYMHFFIISFTLAMKNKRANNNKSNRSSSISIKSIAHTNSHAIFNGNHYHTHTKYPISIENLNKKKTFELEYCVNAFTRDSDNLQLKETHTHKYISLKFTIEIIASISRTHSDSFWCSKRMRVTIIFLEAKTNTCL